VGLESEAVAGGCRAGVGAGWGEIGGIAGFESTFGGIENALPGIDLGFPGFVYFENCLCFQQPPRFVPLIFVFGLLWMSGSGSFRFKC
jgi:hypothetical protein